MDWFLDGEFLFIPSPEVLQLKLSFSETFLSNPLSYLLLLAWNRSSETLFACHITSFYNLGDVLISRCFMGGIDFQMMTLFLVKSTLVSRCVYAREIVCLISRITVSSAYFLYSKLGARPLSSFRMGFAIRLLEKYSSCCLEWLYKYWRLMGAHLGPSIAHFTFMTWWILKQNWAWGRIKGETYN